MLKLKELSIVETRGALRSIPKGKILINTINAHSYNVAQKDELFAEALKTSPQSSSVGNSECVKYLIPDGASVVKHANGLRLSRSRENA